MCYCEGCGGRQGGGDVLSSRQHGLLCGCLGGVVGTVVVGFSEPCRGGNHGGGEFNGCVTPARGDAQGFAFGEMQLRAEGV